MKPLISICIPTYNRKEYLKKSIESIVTQPEFTNGTVEIVISDNASTDETDILCKQFAREYPNLHYYKNQVNVLDENFPLCISRASGTFRKLSNDTFIYHETALKQLCRIVKENLDDKPVIVFMDKNMSGKKFDTVECNSISEFCQNISYFITWNGSFSIWEHECNAIDKDINDCKLHLWQVNKIYGMIKNNQNVKIYNLDILTVQSVKNKDISYGLFDVFYNNFLNISRRYLTEHDIEYLRKDLLFNFFTLYLILSKRKTNLVWSKDEQLFSLIENAYHNDKYWLRYKLYFLYRTFRSNVGFWLKKHNLLKD